MIQEVRPEYAADREIARSVPYIQLLTSLAAVAAAEHKGLSVRRCAAGTMCVESVDFEVTGSCRDLEGNDGYTRGFGGG